MDCAWNGFISIVKAKKKIYIYTNTHIQVK